MTIRDLFNTFIIHQYVYVSTLRGEYYGFVNKDDIPEKFIPYLNYNITEINLETEITGQCCGVDVERPVLYVSIC